MSGRVVKEEQQEAIIYERLSMIRRLLMKTVVLSLFFIAVDVSTTVCVREVVGVFVVTTHVLGMALCVLATRLSLHEHKLAWGACSDIRYVCFDVFLFRQQSPGAVTDANVGTVDNAVKTDIQRR